MLLHKDYKETLFATWIDNMAILNQGYLMTSRQSFYPQALFAPLPEPVHVAAAMYTAACARKLTTGNRGDGTLSQHIFSTQFYNVCAKTLQCAIIQSLS